MVESGSFKVLGPDDTALVQSFLDHAGDSLETFRYFKSRPLSIIANHLLTCVYVENGLVAGYGHLDKEGTDIWLGIAVTQQFRNRGIGSKIFKFLIESSIEYGVKVVKLTVDKSNSAAINLYQKYGFVITRSIDDIVYLMELKNGE